MKLKMLLLVSGLLICLPTANAYSLNLSSDTGTEYSVDFIDGVADTSGLIFTDGDILVLELIGIDNLAIAQTAINIIDLKQSYSVISVNAGDIYFEVYNLPNGAPMVHFSYSILPFAGQTEANTEYLGWCTDTGANSFRSCDMEFLTGADFIVFQVQVHQDIDFVVPLGDSASFSYLIVETYDGLDDLGMKTVDFLWDTNGPVSSTRSYSNTTAFLVETGILVNYDPTIVPNRCIFNDYIDQTSNIEIELVIGTMTSSSIWGSPQPNYYFEWEMTPIQSHSCPSIP